MNVMNSIRDDIFHSIEKYFELKVVDHQQIKLGYRNLKWEIHTSGESLFVKQYHKGRYPEHLIPGLEASLRTQARLWELNLPVPRPYSFKGQYMIHSSNGENFMVTEKCPGKNRAPGTLNEVQMYNLGKAVGEMHTALDTLLPDSEVLHWDIRSKEDMIEDWNERWQEAESVGCEKTLSYLKDQFLVLDQNDTEQFSACEVGWSHWDLFVDNILFEGDEVSAILDFDRLNIVYRDFDIARPILSGCVSNQKLNVKSAIAFVNGFRKYQPLTIERVVRALKLNWWREAEWLSVPKPGRSAVLTRFNDENRWVATHWYQLEEIFSEK
ncbi:phosphotransferase [Jeotgalibacillus malaysiensis]|uniref:phosphotransferase n=1 Tax=Jeotgalibacillus malaysiensis TaxID=1508404 RepID=UPI00384C9D77